MFQITVNALIKRASLFLQSEQKDKCFKDFETAIALDPDNPDIYLHRGQVCFPSLNFTVEPLITGFGFLMPALFGHLLNIKNNLFLTAFRW